MIWVVAPMSAVFSVPKLTPPCETVAPAFSAMACNSMSTVHSPKCHSDSVLNPTGVLPVELFKNQNSDAGAM